VVPQERDVVDRDRSQAVHLDQGFVAHSYQLGHEKRVVLYLLLGESSAKRDLGSLALGELASGSLPSFAASLGFKGVDRNDLLGVVLKGPPDAKRRADFASGVVAQYLFKDADLDSSKLNQAFSGGCNANNRWSHLVPAASTQQSVGVAADVKVPRVTPRSL